MARAFIDSLLVLHPAQRLTAAEALKCVCAVWHTCGMSGPLYLWVVVTYRRCVVCVVGVVL